MRNVARDEPPKFTSLVTDCRENVTVVYARINP